MKTPKTLDRDLSWIYFNHRILQEAQRANVPLLERLSFLGIYSNNLDEFFRVRVSTMKRVAEYESGRSPGARRELREINRLIHAYSEEFEQTFAGILAELEKEGAEGTRPSHHRFSEEPVQLTMDTVDGEVLQKLRSLDVNALTPIQCMNTLFELCSMLK